jgi:GntR family transcriptional repressor for pyruvate dehydrogenase complex
MALSGNAESTGAPPSGPPVRRTAKLSEVVAREIVRDIAERGLQPDTMLPGEAAMVEQYGVGRASLREALRVLEVQGLIVMKPGPGGGPRVARVDSSHFARMTTLYLMLNGATYGDVLQARMVVEPFMVRLAAQRRDPENVRKLEEYIASPQPSVDTRPEDHLLASSEYHGMVSGMSGNPVLDLVAQAIRYVYADRQRGMTYPPEARERVLREHVQIAEAIRDGEADRAESLMREHMAEFGAFAEARYPGILDEPVEWR